MGDSLDFQPSSTAAQISIDAVQPVSTRTILQNFPRQAPQRADAEEINRKRNYLQGIERDQRQILQEVKTWSPKKKRSFRLWQWLNYTPWRENTAYEPPLSERISCAKHFFPPRGLLRVDVCDFGPDRAEHFEVPMGKIEDVMRAKPDWADVRWIHAPLGVGLTHSSVESLFIHGGTRGRDFDRAGVAGWPYLQTEILSFRSRENFQDMCDAIGLLSKDEEVTSELDRHVWEKNESEKLRKDMEWRADHLDKRIRYWDLVSSDIPWQLSEGPSQQYLSRSYDRSNRMKFEVNDQQLSNHPFFEHARFVKDPLRCFHRSDAAGVDFLDKNLTKYLEESPKCMLDNSDASAIALVYQLFAKTGSSTWHRKTVEWFLVYLFTELGGTPHQFRCGASVPSVMSAYDRITQELKDRRFDPWKRNETVKLVRSFLACIDELNAIRMIYGQKHDLLERLLEDCLAFEAEDKEAGRQPDNPAGETAEDRVRFALRLVKNMQDDSRRLSADLTESLTALFQLRSIEQNELAILADSKNKAIFVFTGVTIVFLPLSFFTSYYGMNLKNIENTARSTDYFWKVCGSTALIIVLVTVAFGMRDHIWRSIVLPRKGESPGKGKKFVV